jgi:hypothetical protein
MGTPPAASLDSEISGLGVAASGQSPGPDATALTVASPARGS